MYYLKSVKKKELASSPYGIQENIITPTYENDFVLCKYELIINEIYYIKLHAVKTLSIPTIKRNMPIL